VVVLEGHDRPGGRVYTKKLEVHCSTNLHITMPPTWRPVPSIVVGLKIRSTLRLLCYARPSHPTDRCREDAVWAESGMRPVSSIACPLNVVPRVMYGRRSGFIMQ